MSRTLLFCINRYHVPPISLLHKRQNCDCSRFNNLPFARRLLYLYTYTFMRMQAYS